MDQIVRQWAWGSAVQASMPSTASDATAAAPGNWPRSQSSGWRGEARRTPPPVHVLRPPGPVARPGADRISPATLPTMAAIKTTGPTLQVGNAVEDWTGDARFFEYSRAANPIGSGHTSAIPIRRCAPPDGRSSTGSHAFDLSAELQIEGRPATSPVLLASFDVVVEGESLAVAADATSTLAYVLEGAGTLEGTWGTMEFSAGDVVASPYDAELSVSASEDVLLYRVHDGPLLGYLGARPSATRFAPVRWAAEEIRARLDAIAAEPHAGDRNRLSVLLAGARQPTTLTATHVLWAMFGLLPEGAVQRPHRHQSVALDLIVDCQPGCYTLVGRSIDERGEIVRPERVDWEPGGAFVTPPGLWHAHVNESGSPAHLLPVQDAGLHTYLRSLDIRFAPPDRGAG